MEPNARTGITAKYIVAFDGESHRILENGVLVIKDDKIISVGKNYQGPVDRWIRGEDRIVTPGFVNTHTHMDSAPVTKSLLEDMGNPRFYMSRLFDELIPDLKCATEESVVTSTALSLVELQLT